MERRLLNYTVETWLNTLEVVGILVILTVLLVFQFVFDELHCTECMLLRMGFLCICVGFILNLRFGSRPSHYALSVLGAVFTTFVALRQIALHVLPSAEPYGVMILGMNMYVWAFLLAMCYVIFTSILLGVDIQYKPAHKHNIRFKYLTHLLFLVVVLVVLSNIVYTLQDCGLTMCLDSPV